MRSRHRADQPACQDRFATHLSSDMDQEGNHQVTTTFSCSGLEQSSPAGPAHGTQLSPTKCKFEGFSLVAGGEKDFPHALAIFLPRFRTFCCMPQLPDSERKSVLPCSASTWYQISRERNKDTASWGANLLMVSGMKQPKLDHHQLRALYNGQVQP